MDDANRRVALLDKNNVVTSVLIVGPDWQPLEGYAVVETEWANMGDVYDPAVGAFPTDVAHRKDQEDQAKPQPEPTPIEKLARLGLTPDDLRAALEPTSPRF